MSDEIIPQAHDELSVDELDEVAGGVEPVTQNGTCPTNGNCVAGCGGGTSTTITPTVS